MSDYQPSGTFTAYTPPNSVGGPYVPPSQQAQYMRPVRQPSWRKIVVPSAASLGEVAMRYYQNPSDAIRIFNDNRAGSRMPDGTLGNVSSPNDTVIPGQTIWLS